MCLNQKSPIFTVFSGCYNSAATIGRLFQSIETQTFRDFEWIVIDDNSNDNTVELIDDFLKKHPEIKYKFIKNKINQGIRFSRAKAIKMSRGQYFVKWDHDDIQRPDQLQIFYDVWQKYDGNSIASIWCLCEDEDGNLVGNEYPSDLTISDYFTFYSKYIISYQNFKRRRERHNCIKVDLHNKVNKYLYENFGLHGNEYPTATEIWGTLAYLGYKTIFINKILRKYFIERDRHSMSKEKRKVGALTIYRDRKNWINYYNDKLPLGNFLLRQRNYLSINYYGILIGKKCAEIIKDVNSKRKKNKYIFILFTSITNRKKN